MMKRIHREKAGQTAVEYMLLLGVVVAVVLIAFADRLPLIFESSELYFNKSTNAIMDTPNPCGDGICNGPFETAERCPIDC